MRSNHKEQQVNGCADLEPRACDKSQKEMKVTSGVEIDRTATEVQERRRPRGLEREFQSM